MAINFPSSPANNDIYSYGGQTWYWANNYGVWQSSAGPAFSVSTSAPTSPTSGDIWWNSELGMLFIYYSDGDSSQWVSAVPSAGGGNLANNAIVTLGAGTTTTAPLTFQTGTNLSTANAGVIEYNGTTFFGTPVGQQRGLLLSPQYYKLETAFTGLSSTAAQNLFGVGVTLSSNTVYAFEAVILHSKSVSTTSHTVSYLFGGTATINNIAYNTIQLTTGTQSTYNFIDTAAAGAAVTQATATVIHSSSSVQNIARYTAVRGTVSINNGGTFIPQYQNSATGPIYITNIGSYFLIYPIGPAGSNVSIGTWA